MSLPSAPNARSATSPSSGEVHARRSVRCSLNSLAVSARSSPGTASGSCSSRPRTTRGARHERGRQSPPHSSPRSRASDENREREEEEEEVAKEETVASSQSPLRVRIPSVWSRDLELYLEDPFLGSGAFATILQTTHRSSGRGLETSNRPRSAIIAARSRWRPQAVRCRMKVWSMALTVFLAAVLV